MHLAIQARRHRAERATYSSDVSVWFTLSASASATPPASPSRLLSRLQRREEGQGCSWRYITAGPSRAHDSLKHLERLVALERLRERLAARFADVVESQPAARRAGSELLVVTQDSDHRAACETYESNVSVWLLLSACASATPPASPIWFLSSLQRREEGQRCSWRYTLADSEQNARLTRATSASCWS
jgi:hypothetical protein